MKRTALNHSKTKKLSRLLGLPMYAAVGILECLWHLTANEAPRGDIGKLSDDDIAMSVDWKGDGEKLIWALTEAVLLDLSAEHRLIVHDWPEHCDDAVDARVFRMGIPYADGTPARGTKVGEKEKQSIAARITPKPLDRQARAIGEAMVENIRTNVGALRASGVFMGVGEPMPEPEKIAGSDFTPSEVAMAIIQDAQAGGPRVLMALTDIAKSVMASGLTAEATRDKMLGRWNEYKQVAAQMKWTYSGIEKFFAGGMWDKPEAWPWKEARGGDQSGYNSEAGEVQMSKEEIQAFHARQAEIFKNSPLARLRGSL